MNYFILSENLDYFTFSRTFMNYSHQHETSTSVRSSRTAAERSVRALFLL
jgi:hypothetical protein